MPSRSPQAALLHIRDNIAFAQAVLGNLSYEAFEHDRIKFYAAYLE